ncbi:hypothetical protein K438DRAFT_1984234 [Mycena galopus ATCC 62051]|nr:hypothetical protein K438DRAFT_1984234 [Mycena galopus ATCC 62051]
MAALPPLGAAAATKPLSSGGGIIRCSDDEVQPAVKSSPRYDFRYPKLSTTALPAFEDHPFWQVFGTGASRTLATFALRIRTQGHGASHTSFRLTVSTLDASKLVPKDISLCLVGIFTLTQFANDQDEEWSEFVFPDYSDDPPACHSNDAQLPLAPRDPTLDELQAAPSLMKLTQMPPPPLKCRKASMARIETKVEPPKDGAPPSKRFRNTEVEPQPTLVTETPTRKTRSNDMSTPAKISAVRTPAPETPSKTVAKLLKTLPVIETKLKEIGDLKHEIGWAAFLADDFIVTVAVSCKQGTTIPHARSHVGVTSTHRKSKATDYTMAPLQPMPLIELEAVHNLPVENAVKVRPPSHRLYSLHLLRIKCQPNGVGVTCQSCSYKKMGAICDHTMDTAQFAALMHDLTEKATFFFPTGASSHTSTISFYHPQPVPISIERLKHVADMVTAARKSFALVHREFCLHLHTFICAIRNQGNVLGKEGFRILFKDLKEDKDVAAAFNTLIGHYNASLPNSDMALDVGDEEDAVGELDLSSPKADPGGSLVPYDSDKEVDAQPPKKPVTRTWPGVFFSRSNHRYDNFAITIPSSISAEELAVVLTALRISSTPAAIPTSSVFVPQLGRRYTMTSTPETPDFKLPAGLDKQWAKLLHPIPKFMALSNTDGIHAQLDGADDICALFNPFLEDAHRANSAASMVFHFKIHPVENKVRQYMNTAGSHPEVKDDPPAEAVEEFIRLFDLYREDHRARVKAVNEANRAAALEKAALEKAALEKAVPPSTPKPEADASRSFSKKDEGLSKPAKELPKGADMDKDKAPKRARSESLSPSDVPTELESELDADMPYVPPSQAATAANKCHGCGEFGHWIRSCPNRTKRVIYDPGSRVTVIAGHPPAKKVKPSTKGNSASSSSQANGGSPPEADLSPGIMSYDCVVNIMAEADKLLTRAQKVLFTTEGLLRLDCDIRTVLSLTAARITIEDHHWEPEDFAPINDSPAIRSLLAASCLSRSPPAPELVATIPTLLIADLVARSVVTVTKTWYLGVPALVKNFVQAFF